MKVCVHLSGVKFGSMHITDRPSRHAGPTFTAIENGHAVSRRHVPDHSLLVWILIEDFDAGGLSIQSYRAVLLAASDLLDRRRSAECTECTCQSVHLR